MEHYNILTALLSVPMAGAVIAWIVPKSSQRLYAIFGSILFLALSLYVLAQMGGSPIDLKLSWLPEIGLSLNLKLDSISQWFVLLWRAWVEWPTRQSGKMSFGAA